MNDLIDAIAEWMHLNPWSTGYLIICAVAILQTFAIFGR